MYPKEADGMANYVDLDQTSPYNFNDMVCDPAVGHIDLLLLLYCCFTSTANS